MKHYIKNCEEYVSSNKYIRNTHMLSYWLLISTSITSIFKMYWLDTWISHFMPLYQYVLINLKYHVIDLYLKDHETNSVIAQLFLNAFTSISKYSSARKTIQDYPRRTMAIHLCKNGNLKCTSTFLKHLSEELINMKDNHNENVKFC